MNALLSLTRRVGSARQARVGLVVVLASCLLCGWGSTAASAQDTPEELEAFFASLGLVLDENGQPIPPDPGPQPQSPPLTVSDPPTADEIDQVQAFFAELGIEIDDEGNVVQPEPSANPQPVEPISPEDFFRSLGLDPTDFDLNDVPPNPIEPIEPMPEPPVVEDPVVTEIDPETLPPELLLIFAEAGIVPYDDIDGLRERVFPTPDPAEIASPPSFPPVGTIIPGLPDDVAMLLMGPEMAAQFDAFAAGRSVAVSGVPEPTTFLLIAAGLGAAIAIGRPTRRPTRCRRLVRC